MALSLIRAARCGAKPTRVPRGLILLALLIAATPSSGAGPDGSGYGPPMAQTGPGPGWGRGMGPPWRGRGTGPPGMGPGMGRGMGMLRHRYARMGGMPERYRGMRNPLAPTSKRIAAGKSLYLTHCASCHGDLAQGDGPAAESLQPPPANLSWVVQHPIASDGYLMWAITDGGMALGTAMPAFGEALSETERWKLVLYLKSL